MPQRDLIGEQQLNQALKTITDRHPSINKLEMNTIEFLDEIYNVTSKDQQVLIDDWFKRVITYDLKIEKASYKILVDGTFEISATIDSKRFETLDNGEITEIAINEPIKTGVFTAHPSQVKDDSSVLYYESNQFNKETTEFNIIVKELPTYIAFDPYGTSSDENLTGNLVQL